MENEFIQEQTFHAKLIKQGLIQNGAQSYYKKTNPITSTPNDLRADQWLITNLSIRGQKINPINGVFIHGDMSFAIPKDFDPTQPSIIITCRNQPCRFECNALSEKKVPLLPDFDDYDALVNTIHTNKLSLRHCVTFEKIAEVNERPCIIRIECKNQRTEPIKLRGMEIVCNKDKTTKTKIFFDFTDQENNESIDLCSPIECAHSETVVDNKVICIKDHKVYDCTGKTIYGFFDSPETRRKWVPVESSFYDQNRRVKTSLPSCYSNPDDHQETLKEDILWVFGEGHDSFYQPDNNLITLKATNKYIYHNGGSFFVTLPYETIYKQCFSNNHNAIKVDYLVQVAQPHISIHKSTAIEGGRRIWSTGIYEKISQGECSSWQRIGTQVKDSIDFNDRKPQLDFVFPAEHLTTREIENWCNAAQRLQIDFPITIHSYNQEIVRGLKGWTNLTSLNLSQLKLEKDVTWNTVLTTAGAMKQLKSLRFENNHPIADLMAKWYTNMADLASDYYLALGACLGKLTNLEELHIQGLWLKPHNNLGSGCEGWWVSTEVATLTGIINHKKQAGIKSIIQSICAMQFLKDLSIDGIPNHGSSEFARQTDGNRTGLLPFWILASPVEYFDGKWQDADLKQLVTISANQLAQLAALRTISIYSPGGNCVDYFSKDFSDQLKQINPTLNVIPKDLQ